MAEYFTETSSQQVHQKSRAMLHREVEQATKGLTDIPPVIENSVEGDPAHVLRWRAMRRCWSSDGSAAAWPSRRCWVR